MTINSRLMCAFLDGLALRAAARTANAAMPEGENARRHKGKNETRWS
jgi:hypothetical protein